MLSISITFGPSFDKNLSQFILPFYSAQFTHLFLVDEESPKLDREILIVSLDKLLPKRTLLQLHLHLPL